MTNADCSPPWVSGVGIQLAHGNWNISTVGESDHFRIFSGFRPRSRPVGLFARPRPQSKRVIVSHSYSGEKTVL